MKSTDQTIGTCMVVGCIILTVYWVATDTGLYPLFGQMVGTEWENLTLFVSIYLTFLIPLLICLAGMLAFRRLSGRPGLRAELRNLPQAFRTEHAQNEELYRTQPADLTPAMRRRARYLGIAFLVIGTTFLLAAAMSLIVSLQEDRFYMLQVMLIVMGVFLLGGGVYQIVTGRTVVRKRR